jgi:hypothetical protein
VTDPPDFIGVAKMDEKHNVTLDLYAREGGLRGVAQFVYPPTHAQYRYVLDHVGGLSPGESKPVRPFPEPK